MVDIFNIKQPSDIKELNIKQLEQLSQQMREFLIESISKTGGHLGSSLGTVDLITALHYVFDSPKDKIIFDIGHQAYAHKILTGRAKQFEQLRKYKGMSGFLKQEESIHDVWEAGHSSTSISAAVGYAYARDLDKLNNHVVAVIGDGSMTNGMSMEALNHIIELNQKIIIIINDNEMSISSNVGYIDKILKNLEMHSKYDTTKIKLKNKLNKIDHSQKISKIISLSKNKIKNEINSSQNFFNMMGFKYYGPVNGHDYKDLVNTLNKAKQYNGPVIVHVKTEKGKGYKYAEVNKWHAINPFDVTTGEVIKKSNGLNNSQLVSNTLLQLMDKDEDIVVVSPAMIQGSSLDEILKKYPQRITDTGIAEEHATTMVAALALANKKPFLSIYSTFLQRSYDQILHDIIRQNTNVVIGIDRAGLVGEDGETHQGIYDVSFMMHMHNITIAQGRNAQEIKSLLKLAFETPGCFALRYPRGGNWEVDELNKEIQPIEYGTWEILQLGEQINIISFGEEINKYYNQFKGDNKVGIINARFIKPIDLQTLNLISDKKILIVEDNIRLGGLNSMIFDYYNQNNIKYKEIKVLAIDDHFVEQGSVEQLKKQEKIDLEAVCNMVEKMKNE